MKQVQADPKLQFLLDIGSAKAPRCHCCRADWFWQNITPLPGGIYRIECIRCRATRTIDPRKYVNK